MRERVDKQGRQSLQELRLRVGLPPELCFHGNSQWLDRIVTQEDITFCINAASRYSPWHAATISDGYITAPGGHRLGICGQASVHDEKIRTVANPFSICLRVARDFEGIARGADTAAGSVLIIGKPGSGKTTLLRDLIRRRSDNGFGSVSVVDEKGEIFPTADGKPCFPTGKRTDILSNCKKPQAIDSVLRNMGPDTIAVDEITSKTDCDALMQAGWCGVKLIATAHAADRADLYHRGVYRPIVESRLFQSLLVLQPDQTWRIERMDK